MFLYKSNSTMLWIFVLSQQYYSDDYKKLQRCENLRPNNANWIALLHKFMNLEISLAFWT